MEIKSIYRTQTNEKAISPCKIQKINEQMSDVKEGQEKAQIIMNVDKPARRNSGVIRERKSLTGLFYLIEALNDIESKNQKIPCGNKFCSEVTSQNTKEEGWTRRKIQGKLTELCKECSQAYKQKQYCDYCKQIYTDTSDTGAIVDGLDWIQCEQCKRWTHIQCECKEGTYKIEILSKPEIRYHCRDCRKNLNIRGNRKRVSQV